MNHPTRPLIEITDEAFRLLTQAMGPSDTIRFLAQFSNGNGNYTEDRRAKFEHLELDEILAELPEVNAAAA